MSLLMFSSSVVASIVIVHANLRREHDAVVLYRRRLIKRDDCAAFSIFAQRVAGIPGISLNSSQHAHCPPPRAHPPRGGIATTILLPGGGACCCPLWGARSRTVPRMLRQRQPIYWTNARNDCTGIRTCSLAVRPLSSLFLNERVRRGAPSGTEVRDIQRRVRANNCAALPLPSPPGRSRGLGDPRGRRRGSRKGCVVGCSLAWRAAPGTTLETALHPLYVLHHRVFVRCKRSLVRWSRPASVITMAQKVQI